LPSAELQRLPSSPNYRALAGLHGKLILRPWFDTVALGFVAKWFCPLSRAWAAASTSNGSVEEFSDDLALPGLNLSQYAGALRKISQSHRAFRMICDDWENAFFDDANPSPGELVDYHIELFKGERHQLSMRRHFLSLRPHLDPLKWDISTPGQVAELQASHSIETPFPSPVDTEITQSASVPGEWGDEFHLKMHSSTGYPADLARAHVFMPADGEVRGTFVFLHGVGLEPVIWDALAYPAKALTRQGIRVVLPTGPWHGRRTPDGLFGGENILRCGPLGFIEGFQSWVSEVALWIRWANATASAPVGIGGVSLGALTAQLAASAANEWPETDQPDALILITTTNDMTAIAFDSSMVEQLRIKEEIQNHGWTAETLKPLLPFLQPGDSPGLSAKKIVMLLGSADRVTPFPGGVALVERWKVPDTNLFIRKQGHFSGALGLSHDAAPLQRFADLLLQI
jgi:pimeloyl-ACP methyl ester carboxylesterase